MNLKFNGHKQNYLGWWWQEQEHRVTGEIEWGRSNQQESEWDRPKIEWFRDEQCWRQYRWLMSAARDFSGHRMEEKKRSGGERDRGWRETLFRRLMWDQRGWEMKMVKEFAWRELKVSMRGRLKEVDSDSDHNTAEISDWEWDWALIEFWRVRLGFGDWT